MATNDTRTGDDSGSSPERTSERLGEQYRLVRELARLEAEGRPGDDEVYDRLLEEVRRLEAVTTESCRHLDREELEQVLREISN